MRSARLAAVTLPVLLLLAGCGEDGIDLAASDPDYRGAQIFDQNCAACHTLGAAGGQGSASNIDTREYKDGPNFNQRAEPELDKVLYAIRNGGFSSGPMPQNIVTGADAEAVARFVVKYSGTDGNERRK